ncbi:MAG TPA: GNAT family N-acetyltransferase [Stellaceae bacterium]|nr:GNAT family N-acetyltransferase [Stellaceae bacterium]
MLDLREVPTLETFRLRLRRPGESDTEGLAAMFADARYMRFLGDGKTADRAEAWCAIAGTLGHWVLRGHGLFSIEEKTTGRFIGWSGLLSPEGWPGVEIAWGIAPDFWGRGLATEAATSVRDYAFLGLRLPRLVSLIHPENAASIRVAAKIGECFEHAIEFQGRSLSLYAIAAPWARSR